MRPNRLAIIATIALALVACSTGATPPPSARPTIVPTQAPASPQETGSEEIGCDAGGHDGAYHIHSLVVVKVDGQLYAPPAHIGIGQSCMYWVHTHKADGIVHVEAPASVTPTLGDFLDLWQATYPDDQLLAAARAAIGAGQVTVDDAPHSGNATGLALADQMRIVLGS